ncbi:Putative Sak1 [Rhizopus microsporus]|nr:Putative Sak1 [Rhizopus microsporus]
MMLPSVHSSIDNDDSNGEDKQSSAVDSSNNPTRATQNVNNSNNDTSDILDPIMADREANMHVTTWARSNYIQERDHNVPRRNMYEHYKAHCAARNLTPVNSATFGKLIRVVFPDLKTRRLGVRGQSKYHYCGIRVRASNEPNQTNDQILTITEDNSGSTRDNISTSPSAASSVHPTASNILDPSISIQLPPFMKPNILSYTHTNELDATIHSFISAYENHCRQILYLVTHHQVDKIQQVMALFYDRMPENFRLLIHEVPEITEAVWRYDSLFYDTIIERFLPTVNYPLSQAMMITLRTYTRELSNYIDAFVSQFPINFYQKKFDVARIFAAKFRRHLSLNHAAQTATAVLNMPEYLSAMRKDWEQLDFDGLLDQTLWVCDCNTTDIRHILNQEIYDLLTVKISLDHWMNWVSSIVDSYLKKFTPSSSNDASHYLVQAKHFLLKWNFYTSLIMKGLARQNARSFSSFHTIHLFLDDYALYLVEETIAQANYILMRQQQVIQQAESSSTATTSTSVTRTNIYSSPSSSTSKGNLS